MEKLGLWGTAVVFLMAVSFGAVVHAETPCKAEVCKALEKRIQHACLDVRQKSVAVLLETGDYCFCYCRGNATLDMYFSEEALEEVWER